MLDFQFCFQLSRTGLSGGGAWGQGGRLSGVKKVVNESHRPHQEVTNQGSFVNGVLIGRRSEAETSHWLDAHVRHGPTTEVCRVLCGARRGPRRSHPSVWQHSASLASIFLSRSIRIPSLVTPPSLHASCTLAPVAAVATGSGSPQRKETTRRHRRSPPSIRFSGNLRSSQLRNRLPVCRPSGHICQRLAPKCPRSLSHASRHHVSVYNGGG